MRELAKLVNRKRMQCWKYDQKKEQLMKMGNSEQEASDAINEYIEDSCGTHQKER